MSKISKCIIKGELIGSHVNVVGTLHRGIILDETKTRFVIQADGGKRKIIVKEANKFEFDVDNQKIIVDGKDLAFRPEDRIKIKVKAKS